MEKCLLVDIRIKNLYLVVSIHSGKEILPCVPYIEPCTKL